MIRLEAIPKEIEMFRSSLEAAEGQRAIKLEGLWKGVEISKEDIEKAECSLFKEAFEIWRSLTESFVVDTHALAWFITQSPRHSKGATYD